MKATGFNICLLKENVGSFAAAISKEKQVDEHPLGAAVGLGFSGTLFVGRQNEFTPRWVDLLNPFLQVPVRRALSANISAVLLAGYENRIFAVCFGHGKSLLAASSWVRDFGLKVTLNRVDPAKLRSVDSKTYEDLVVSTRRQTSRGSDVANFQLDVARDLVRGVTGDPIDKTFFTRLTGADSLALVTELPFEDFADLLDELLVAYHEDKYKANFGWIDNVKEVDLSVREKLDQLLVAALRAGNADGMHLAPADVVEWRDIAGFNYTGGKKSITYPELELRDYMEVLGEKRTELSLDKLRHHMVRTRLAGSDELDNQWPVYQCLVWEAGLDEAKYVLFDGRWFEIEKGYARRVEKYVNSISANSVALPEAEAGEDEGKYNQHVADQDPRKFALLDRQTVRPDRAASAIEFCDLMTSAGHFVHVKKRSSSATLSHLFSQGSVACDAFLQDPGVRREIRKKLLKQAKNSHASLIPKTRPTPSDYEVVYAVIAQNALKWPPALPFFSAVNLMHHSSRIQNLGFKVSIQHVKQM